jgi:NADPH-dependent 2,4-dienoyl-CoA reductase/sulfur reductase-like enzyme
MNKYVIIGGVAGGMSAATRLRRLDNKAEIIVIEKSGYVSYANCGLPYFIGGVIQNEQDLLLQTPESLNRRFDLDVRVHSEVFAINPASKIVSVKNLATNEI